MTAAVVISDEAVYVDGGGISFAAHKMTLQEMQDMQKVVGVREPGRN